MKLEHKYSESVIERGKGYLDSVRYCIKINDSIFGKVEGSATYKTELDLDSLEGYCSCPYNTNCKHAVALYLTYQKGKFWDSNDFIKNLSKMSKNELKELILSKLEDNPDWVIKHSLRKNANMKGFVKSFKKNFSSDKITEAEAIMEGLSFDKLLELQDYISKYYDELAEKLGEEKENKEYGYEYWDDESYDEELAELNGKLIKLLVKKALEKRKTGEIIKRESFRDEIINEAEAFISFKEEIRKKFSMEEYLEFLLTLKNPDIQEIKKHIYEKNKSILYYFIDKKPTLINRIAESTNDKTLTFSVAVYENDFDNILKNFAQFENALNEYPGAIGRLSDVVDLFIRKNIRNEEIAKKLLTRHISARYDKKQIFYLASQIKDFDFIKKIFNKEHIEKDVALLERLAQIDKQRTFQFICGKTKLFRGHWSEVIVLFNFLKRNYEKGKIKRFIEKNQELFKTSSYLKKHLKDIGIFISIRNNGTVVEIR